MVYSVTGQLVKIFEGKVKSEAYDITDLNSGVYLVKVSDANHNEKP